MRHSKQAPQVNAGSMADIAFLLLIFFLVTATIPNDQGINRKLPRICSQGQDCNIDIHERNILRIRINNKQELMIEDDLVTLDQVKEISKTFLENNGDNSCGYCSGLGLKESSDNPTSAVISLQVDNETHYNLYVLVQDELTKAYFELRANYAKQYFDKSPNKMTVEELRMAREAYPFLVSEATTN